MVSFFFFLLLFLVFVFLLFKALIILLLFKSHRLIFLFCLWLWKVRFYKSLYNLCFYTGTYPFVDSFSSLYFFSRSYENQYWLNWLLYIYWLPWMAVYSLGRICCFTLFSCSFCWNLFDETHYPMLWKWPWLFVSFSSQRNIFPQPSAVCFLLWGRSLSCRDAWNPPAATASRFS